MGNLSDYTSRRRRACRGSSSARARHPLALGLALRAVALPIVAVLFNLLTAAAAFGAMQLLFGGANPRLGGPGYIDPVSITEIFAAIFGISAIFVVLLLTRTPRSVRAGASVDGALASPCAAPRP